MMKTLFVLTLIYSLVGAFFYFNGIMSVGNSFVTEVKSIEKVGEKIPFALGIGLVYLWVLVGVIKYFNQTLIKSSKLVATENSEDLVASSKDI